MTVCRQWKDDSGASATFIAGRLSIFAEPSMTADDGMVAVGIDAPWITELLQSSAAALGGQESQAAGSARGVTERTTPRATTSTDGEA